MRTIPAMVDMKMTPAEAQEANAPSPPAYPWGLCISLTEDELEKLDLMDEDLEVGDMLHLHCFAKVTSVSKRADVNGDCCRVELQITNIAAEDEDEENEEEDEPPRRSKLYG